jgi:hypothetical protein
MVFPSYGFYFKFQYDNTYNDFTYNDFTYNNFTYNDDSSPAIPLASL